MAKPITLADLNHALKPIMEALDMLRGERAWMAETHALVTNMSVKMDSLEQLTGATLSEVSKPVTKKSTGRKPAAPKKAAPKKATSKKVAPTRKAPVKKGSKADLDADVDADVNQADETDKDADASADVDVEADVDADVDVDANQADETDKDADADTSADINVTPKKAPPKKAAPKKAAPKKAPLKKAAPKKVAAPRLNKMTIFRDEYKTNPSQFDKYLTAKVKKTIESDNEKWGELSGDALANAQRTAYYHFMKDKHDDVLESLKTARTEL